MHLVREEGSSHQDRNVFRTEIHELELFHRQIDLTDTAILHNYRRIDTDIDKDKIVAKGIAANRKDGGAVNKSGNKIPRGGSKVLRIDCATESPHESRIRCTERLMQSTRQYMIAYHAMDVDYACNSAKLTAYSARPEIASRQQESNDRPPAFLCLRPAILADASDGDSRGKGTKASLNAI